MAYTLVYSQRRATNRSAAEGGSANTAGIEPGPLVGEGRTATGSVTGTPVRGGAAQTMGDCAGAC